MASDEHIIYYMPHNILISNSLESSIQTLYTDFERYTVLHTSIMSINASLKSSMNEEKTVTARMLLV